MAVMMQGFYWDCAVKEDKRGEWWNFLATQVPRLGKHGAGFDSIWLPPFSKASNPNSCGYDPYDYFDLGDFNQKGALKTSYGNSEELRRLIAVIHTNGMGAIADMVINHNSGGDVEEINPLDGIKRWTKFNPASGRFPRDWTCFHPSRYERFLLEGEKYGDFAHLCHRNPHVYAGIFDYARMVIEDLDCDGFRFDFVKGFGAWVIGLLANYQYQKKDGREFTPFVVGEHWSSRDDIVNWLEGVSSVTGGEVAAFDFPLRYKLKALCDTQDFDLRNLADGQSVSALRPFHAVTFTENHDMGGNEVVHDKMLGYSFILTHGGYPCVFWWDYYNCNLARPGTPHGIDALIAAHHAHAGGDSSILHADHDLYIAQRAGTDKQTGLVYVLNNLGNGWNGAKVKTCWPNQRFKPVAWDGNDDTSPNERTTNADGVSEFPAPPRGYCVYAPVKN